MRDNSFPLLRWRAGRCLELRNYAEADLLVSCQNLVNFQIQNQSGILAILSQTPESQFFLFSVSLREYGSHHETA